MEMMKKYQAGVNLGGWLSQYGDELQKTHLETFIVEADIRRIAEWGMDHVRLPVDYPVIEDDARPFEYKEEGIAYIRNCIGWCKKYGLNLVLDLHRTSGYSHATLEANSLFDDVAAQQRFLGIWEMLAETFIEERDHVIFDLLNEIVEPDSSRWNALAKKAVDTIREIDRDRKIMIGSNHYSSVYTLKEMDILDDPDIIYTFHFYESHLFTHQKAHWNEIFVKYGQELAYPGEFTGLEAFLDQNENYRKDFERYIGVRQDKVLMLKELVSVIEFMRRTGREVYCGEYGVIENAPLQSRINWHRDFVDLMKELKIGRAVWTYKSMNFGLVDINGDIVNEELVKIVSEK